MGKPEECHCPCGYEPVLRRTPLEVVITRQPQNATLYDDIAIFTISSTIDQLSDYYYQWQKKRFFEDQFVDIPNAQGSTLVIQSPSLDDENSRYRVYIGHYGNESPVYSDEATLSLGREPVTPVITIQRQPQDLDLGLSDSGTIDVEVSVDQNVRLFYQWQVKKRGVGLFENIKGENSTVLHLKSLDFDRDNLNEYRVVVKAFATSTSITSESAQINLLRRPKIKILDQPSDQNSINGSASFSINAEADDQSPVFYIWQRKRSSESTFTTIENAVSNTITVGNLNNRDDDGSIFRCLVYTIDPNKYKLSQYARLSVPKSKITVINPDTFAPTSVSGAIDLSVEALITSGDELIYQWQKKSSQFSDQFLSIPEGTGSLLSLSGLEYDVDDNNVYRVILSAKFSPGVSASQFYTVNVPYAPKISIEEDTQLISSLSGNIGSERSFSLLSTANLEFNEVTQVSGQLFGIWQQYNQESNSWLDIQGESGNVLEVNQASFLTYNNQDFRRFYTSDQVSTPKNSTPFTVFLDKPTISLVSDFPISFSGLDGSAEVSVEASVNFNQTLSYQWQKLNKQTSQYEDIENTNNPTLRLENLTYLGNNLDRYRVIISATDGADDLVTPFTTLVIERPVISIRKNISNQTALGHSAVFSVSAEISNTSEEIPFQWQKKESNSNLFLNVPGQNKNFISLSNLIRANDDGDVYRVGLKGVDGASSLISDEATLSVFVPTVEITSQPQDTFSNEGSAIFRISVDTTFEGIPEYQWSVKRENENNFSNLRKTTTPYLDLSGISFFTDNNSFYKVEVGTLEPETVTVTSREALLQVPIIGVFSNISNSYIIDQPRLFGTFISNASKSYLIDQKPTYVIKTEISNSNLSYLIDQQPVYIYNNYLGCIFMDSCIDSDILRFTYSGVPTLQSGIISQKFMNLFVEPYIDNEGSEILGYGIELTNKTTSEVNNLLVEQTGSYVRFTDDLFLSDFSDYDVRIKNVHSQDLNPAPFGSSIFIQQSKPPLPVVNVSVSQPSDWQEARNNLNVNWDVSIDELYPPTAYQVEQSGYGDASYTILRSSGELNNDTFLYASGLIKGNLYSYRVYASNIEGVSSPVIASGSTSDLVFIETNLSSDSSIVAEAVVPPRPTTTKIGYSVVNVYKPNDFPYSLNLANSFINVLVTKDL